MIYIFSQPKKSKLFHPNLQINFRSTKLCAEKCNDDYNCKGKEICLNGECQEGCTNDNHCKKGQKCYEKSCVPSCEDSSDCPLTGFCHSVDEKPQLCVTIRPSCHIDDGVCHFCKSDKDCAGGYKCSNGHKVLNSSTTQVQKQFK